MHKKSLTVITHNLDCGGTEKVLTNIIYHYSKNNIETTIITLGKAKIFSALRISKKTKIIELPKICSNNIFLKITNIFIWIFKIRKYIKNNKDSIYLSFLTTPNILTVLSSLNMRIIHHGSERINPEFINLSLHWKLLRFITYSRMTTLIVQTEEIKKKFLSFIPARRVNVIPNSVKNIINQKQIKKINDKKLKVLFIGRLEYQKGVDVILDSIIEIFNSKNKDDFKFEIVGNGSLVKLVEDTIKKNNLSNYIKFTRGTSKPSQYMKNCHIILHASRYEGMSNVVIEGMSFGKCVISTKQASSEIITSNKDGILMESVSAVQIIKSLEKISINRVLLKKIGINAINKIKNNYSEERIFKLWDGALKLNI